MKRSRTLLSKTSRGAIVGVAVAAVVIVGGVSAITAAVNNSDGPAVGTVSVAATEPRNLVPPRPSENTDPAGLSVFGQPRDSDDALSSGLLHLPLADRIGNPNAARLATVSVGTAVYLVPGASPGSVCVSGVLDASTDPPFSFGTCGSAEQLKNGAMTVAQQLSDGRKRVVGAVGDDVTEIDVESGRVRTMARSNGFAMIVPGDERALVLRTPSTETRSATLP